MDESLKISSKSLKSDNLTSDSIGLKFTESECLLAHQSNVKLEPFTPNIAMKPGGFVTPIPFIFPPPQWIPAFAFPAMFSHTSKLVHNCTFMPAAKPSKRSIPSPPNGYFPSKMSLDLSNAIDNLMTMEAKSKMNEQRCPPQNLISNPSGQIEILYLDCIKNPVTSGLKLFLKNTRNCELQKLSQIPTEVVNLPFFDVKPKLTKFHSESFREENKRSKKILDRKEWAERCSELFLINVPMLVREDLKSIAAAALALANCNTAACIKVERFGVDEIEMALWKHKDPIRSPPILMKFENARTRCHFMTEFNRNKVRLSDFKSVWKSESSPDALVYAEEHLTSKNQEILEKVEKLKLLKAIDHFKIIDGKVAIFMSGIEQETIIHEIEDLYDALQKRAIFMRQFQILYKSQINALKDQTFSECFDKWLQVKSELIEDILEN